MTVGKVSEAAVLIPRHRKTKAQETFHTAPLSSRGTGRIGRPRDEGGRRLIDGLSCEAASGLENGHEARSPEGAGHKKTHFRREVGRPHEFQGNSAGITSDGDAAIIAAGRCEGFASDRTDDASGRNHRGPECATAHQGREGLGEDVHGGREGLSRCNERERPIGRKNQEGRRK